MHLIKKIKKMELIMIKKRKVGKCSQLVIAGLSLVEIFPSFFLQFRLNFYQISSSFLFFILIFRISSFVGEVFEASEDVGEFLVKS